MPATVSAKKISSLYADSANHDGQCLFATAATCGASISFSSVESFHSSPADPTAIASAKPTHPAACSAVNTGQGREAPPSSTGSPAPGTSAPTSAATASKFAASASDGIIELPAAETEPLALFSAAVPGAAALVLDFDGRRFFFFRLFDPDGRPRLTAVSSSVIRISGIDADRCAA
jgi:hypothetical protein